VTVDREVLDRLVRIETKIDSIIDRGDDHEKRIRRLERALWLAIGAAPAAGGTAGWLYQQLMGGV
jgi:hypothetical protein